MISIFRRARKHAFLFRSIHCCRKSLSPQSSVQEEPCNVDKYAEEKDPQNFYIDARNKVTLSGSGVKVKLTDKVIEDKIIYNSFVDTFMDCSPFMDRLKKYSKLNSLENTRKGKEFLSKKVDSVVASLIKTSQNENNEIDKIEELHIEEHDGVSFPYLAHTPVHKKLEKFKSKIQSRLQDLYLEDDVEYGSPDPSIPVSKIPCGGCGAMLHCQSPSIPGYLPSEIFNSCQAHDLRGQICQRCRFLREHDVALNVNISPDDYPKVISVIRDQIAMVVLVVDLVDFPCSIWPGLLEIIGTKRPVCVVGNKVDLIPKDSKGYLEHIKGCLITELEKTGIDRANIKHVSLISATTGYGVEQLITKIQNSWGSRGDVYLLGCTNVGKSSLFNALISSDFCKTQASDLLERATVSAWPGTTLNL